MKKRTALLLILCLLLAATTGCAATTRMQASFFGTFDTVVTLMGYVDQASIFDEAFAEVQRQFLRYHQVYDMYHPYEGVHNVYYMNQNAANGPVKVEPELIDLLLECKAYQPLTHGTVNVAMGTVLQLWHTYRDEGTADPAKAALPPMDQLEAAAQHIRFDDILIDEEAGTVAYLDPALQVDVGAVAKGYATERVAQWLLQSGMPSFLLSAGGNVRAGASPLDGRLYWGVSIQDPSASIFGSANEGMLDVLFVAGKSVVTSGDYQRYYVVDGQAYHHLISPQTLMPADHYRSVTVVCEDSGLADLYSTAFFILPYEEGRALADSLEGVDVMWVLNDGLNTLEMTDGMLRMSRDFGGATSRTPQED